MATLKHTFPRAQKNPVEQSATVSRPVRGWVCPTMLPKPYAAITIPEKKTMLSDLSVCVMPREQTMLTERLSTQTKQAAIPIQFA